ncbi:hypothetical protein BHM03_00043246, partial [Ensete ventricosum]
RNSTLPHLLNILDRSVEIPLASSPWPPASPSLSHPSREEASLDDLVSSQSQPIPHW